MSAINSFASEPDDQTNYGQKGSTDPGYLPGGPVRTSSAPTVLPSP